VSEFNPSLEEALFEAAAAKPTAAERSAFLQGVCRDNSTLRARLELLLEGHFQAEGFLPEEPQKVEANPATPSLQMDASICIGRYKLLEKLGEGGFGEVWMAEQKEPLKRRVALKIIKLGMDTRQVVARFEAERQALALMDHTNIAKVLDAGATTTGRPYFVMELVRGVRITEYCDNNQLPTHERLKLFIQVCRAIQHAHQKGIIHRDIKPSNILVTLHDGVPVPKVIDFGIAKATQQELTDKTVFTQFRQFLGTPAYISPEQAEMGGLDIDTRSDIYSLGVLLYELLTGTTPFDTQELIKAGLEGMRQIIGERQPARPSTRLSRRLADGADGVVGRSKIKSQKPRIRADLDWIVMKCLQKDRARRYETANDLARDIERHLANEPVWARPPSRLYEFQKTARRHWVGFSAGAAVFIALALGIAVSTLETVRARHAERAQIILSGAAQRAQAGETEQRRRVEEAQRYAERLLYGARMNLAQQAWEQNNMGKLRQLLADTAGSAERGFEWYYWQRQAHQEFKTLHGHRDELTSVALSSDGHLIITGSSDRTAKVWDIESGKELFTLTGFFGQVISVAFSPDIRRIATAGIDPTAKIWDVTTRKLLLTLAGHSDQVNSIVFSPDSRRVATGSGAYDDTARIWDALTGHELLVLRGHGGGVGSVVFSPDGQRVATGSWDKTARVWDATTGKELLTLSGHRAEVNSVRFAPDGGRILTASNDRTAKLWDAASGKELLALEGHRDAVNTAVFSWDGHRIITASDDATAKMWDAIKGTDLFTFKGHDRKIPFVASSPRNQLFVTAGADGTARLWKMADNLGGIILTGHSLETRHTGILATAFSADGRLVVTGDEDRTAKVWDASSGKELLVLSGHTGPIVAVAFSSETRRIITAGLEGTVKLWDAATGELLRTFTGHNARIFSLALSPDCRRILTAGEDHTARISDLSTGHQLMRLEGHRKAILTVAFSADGQRVVTGSADSRAKIWDALTGRLLLTLERPDLAWGADWVWAVAFSPDGQTIATGYSSGTVTLWDAASGKQLLFLKSHTADINALAFSPDGRRILSGSRDTTAKLWDVVTGAELLTLKGHSAPIRSVLFSPDGHRILTASQDDSARIWETATTDQIAAWRKADLADAEQLATTERAHRSADEQKRAAQPQDPGGIINQWLILSPIPYTNETGAGALAQQQVPEEANLRPRAGERIDLSTADGGERIWTEANLQDYIIDFSKYSRADWCVGYAVCYIESDAEKTNLCLKIGSDDQSKVYLNGKEIYRCERARAYIPDQDTVTGVELRAGSNLLVFKVVNETDSWLGSIRFAHPPGQPLKGIRVSLTPPETAPPEQPDQGTEAP
jgi:WD40 repeat protein/tRNA A-37 threonylcarbamoyl transferase component Bud32